MAMIGELRKGKELATHYVDLDAKGQAEFIDDVVARLVPPGPNAPSVCILDAGVNRSHPLLGQLWPRMINIPHKTNGA